MAKPGAGSAALPQVAVSLFDLTLGEITDAMAATVPDGDKHKLYEKMEKIGYRVGLALFEGLTRSGPRFKEQLDIIKFVCKDFWNVAYQKNIDNLRTNHKGVYVLHDNSFRVFAHMGTGAQYLDEAKQLLAFPCGLIRGGLASVDITCDVKGEVSQLPACKFSLEIKNKPSS